MEKIKELKKRVYLTKREYNQLKKYIDPDYYTFEPRHNLYYKIEFYNQ